MNRLLFSGLLYLFLGFAAGAVAEEEKLEALRRLIKSAPASDFAASVIELPSQHVFFESNADTPLKPASTMKLALSAAALSSLGTEHTFKTSVRASGWKGDVVGELAIVGGGDPLLTIENLWLLIRRVARRGINHVESIVIDDSLFEETVARQGQRAYQTAPGALGFNFNSVAINVCPAAAARRVGLVFVDPTEAGFHIVNKVRTVEGRGVQVDASELPDGKGYAVSGTIGVGAGCETVYRSVSDPRRYVLESVRHFLKKEGISVAPKSRFGLAAPDAVTVAEHRSLPLRDIVSGLNHFSNNFTAEQILFALGTGAPGGKLSRVRGLEQVRNFLISLGVSSEGMVIADGSGLSHENRLSARGLSLVLSKMSHDPKFQPEFESSLSIGARSGTLKDRQFPAQGLVRAKTGSLDGVSALAGYVTTASGKKFAFALIQNGATSKENANRFEERFVAALAK